MLRKDESVLSLKPQPASEDVCMLRKDESVLSLEPQPDSEGMGMLRKDKSVLSLEATARFFRCGNGPKRQKCALA